MSNLYSINVAHTRGHVTRTLSGVIAATFLSCYVPVFAKKEKKKENEKTFVVESEVCNEIQWV